MNDIDPQTLNAFRIMLAALKIIAAKGGPNEKRIAEAALADVRETLEGKP